MKGHTLPGINQKSDGNTTEGRSKSSAFQMAAGPGKMGAASKAMKGTGTKVGGAGLLNGGAKGAKAIGIGKQSAGKMGGLKEAAKGVDTKLQTFGKKHSAWKEGRKAKGAENFKKHSDAQKLQRTTGKSKFKTDVAAKRKSMRYNKKMNPDGDNLPTGIDKFPNTKGNIAKNKQTVSSNNFGKGQEKVVSGDNQLVNQEIKSIKTTAVKPKTKSLKTIKNDISGQSNHSIRKSGRTNPWEDKKEIDPKNPGGFKKKAPTRKKSPAKKSPLYMCGCGKKACKGCSAGRKK